MRNRTIRREKVKEDYRKAKKRNKKRISFTEFWRKRLKKEGNINE